MIWAKDFGADKGMEIPEYFVYCGIFIPHIWGKRFAQIAKGEFLEVPNKKWLQESIPAAITKTHSAPWAQCHLYQPKNENTFPQKGAAKTRGRSRLLFRAEYQQEVLFILSAPFFFI